MAKFTLFWLLTAILLTATPPVRAQQPGKMPRIAYLSGSANIPPNTDALRQGLRELGYVEGKNIIIEWRFAEGDRERQRALAAELVQLKIDVIVASGGGDVRAAKEVTSTIPIVMAQSDDPVANGFVTSLARPGGNITGLSTLAPELSGKRLEILKEVVPKLTRAAVFGTSNSPGDAPTLNETKLAARALGISIHYIDVRSPKDFESAFLEARKAKSDAAAWQVSGAVSGGRSRAPIFEAAVKHRLPVIYQGTGFPLEGGLMSYGVYLPDLHRRAAVYVDKILKGTKPADLPVEQAMKFEFNVNLNAAKQIGLTIPPNVLVRADRVIR